VEILMKKCYKCQKVYVEPNGPGFQDVCDSCGSYLHCCQNCYFYDPYQHNSCTETQAEWVSDANGMNRCEYFKFKVLGGNRQLDSNEGDGRRFKKADWRNVNTDKNNGGPQRRHAGSFDDRSGGGRGGRGGRDRPARSGGLGGNDLGGGGDRAQKAREALDRLFRKD
jgi:hypothetical protein